MTWFSPAFRIFKKSWTWLAAGLLCVLLVVAGIQFLSYHAVGGLRAHVVLSGSMAPNIPVGSLVITRRIPVRRYVAGDVIAFTPPTRERAVVVHRITALSPNRYGTVEVQTRGDANTNGDPWVISLGAIQGKVQLVIPWLGWPLHVVTVPIGFLLIAAFLFFALVAKELLFLIRSLRFL